MRRLIWSWSWACWWLATNLPCGWNYTRLGILLLPWAGVYAYTDGGWAEFKKNGLQHRAPDLRGPEITIIYTGAEPL